MHFSVKRGFFKAPFNLSLTTETPDAVIRYTLNGSVPTEASGLIYTNLLAINTTRIVRAAAFQTNFLPSRVDTHTYLYNIASNRRLLPALSLVTATNNLRGPTGIMEINPRNTTKHGIAWERPVSAELIAPRTTADSTSIAAFAFKGRLRPGLYDPNGGLPYSKYSFRLYFRGDYGEGRLNYPLFPEIPVQSFDTIVLRAGMNDPTNPFIRDELARRLASDTGQVASHGTFVNLFINGV